MQNIEAENFIRALKEGQYDADIQEIFDSVNRELGPAKRRRAERAAKEVQVGSRVRITLIKPMAFTGYEGIVTAYQPGKVDRFEVKLDAPEYLFTAQMRRYLRNGTFNLPAGTFEVIG